MNRTIPHSTSDTQNPAGRTFRLGAPDFTNSLPLIWSLESEPEVQLILDSPSRLAGMLKENKLDAALVSSIEYFRNDYEILVPLGIAARREAMSVCLFSESPLPNIKRIFLDERSLSANALLRIILSEKYPKLSPGFASADPESATPCDEGDGLLIIGDTCLAVSMNREYRFSYDLGTEWYELTGLPFVFALWLGMPKKDKGLTRLLERVKEKDSALMDSVIAEANSRLRILAKGIGDEEISLLTKNYFEKALNYELGDEEIRALELFNYYLVEIGEVPRLKEVKIFD